MLPSSNLSNISYIDRAAYALGVDLKKSSGIDVLRVYKYAIKSIADELYNPDLKLGEDFPKTFLDNVLQRDLSRIILGLRNYRGKDQRGVPETKKYLEDALRAVIGASNAKSNESRAGSLIRCRNFLDNAFAHIEHVD